MKILILTVAGMSTRFSKSLGKPCLKCIYYSKSFSESLLYKMLHQKVDFDKYIIVGGYMFDKLKEVIDKEFCDFKNKIILVKNEMYAEYGSGYSLYMGLKTAMTLPFDEIVFAEGDLFIDSESFENICLSPKSIVTRNSEPVLASKAVAFFFDVHNCIHYIYDTGHNALEINVPFLSVYNSGQVWKFAQADKLREVYNSITETQWQGTNLVLVEKYFQAINRNDYDIVPFKKWINCNTVDDFESI